MHENMHPCASPRASLDMCRQDAREEKLSRKYLMVSSIYPDSLLRGKAFKRKAQFARPFVISSHQGFSISSINTTV